MMRWKCQKKHSLLDELKCKMPEASKTTLRQMLREERVLINNEFAKKNIDLNPGNIIELGQKKTYETDLTIYHLDEDIVVVEKPHGLLSVATKKEPFNTLHNKLKDLYGRVWPVQRLDKETSGVLVFALSIEAKEKLKEQFMDHAVFREYRAIVHGDIPKKGTWKHQLVEDGNLKMHVTNVKGLYAETHFEVIDTKDPLSFVSFRLKTGKKNQIRVQASHMECPILGDKKYGNLQIKCERMYLHAHKLGFKHPITGKNMSFTSSIPFEINDLFGSIRRYEKTLQRQVR